MPWTSRGRDWMDAVEALDALGAFEALDTLGSLDTLDALDALGVPDALGTRVRRAARPVESPTDDDLGRLCGAEHPDR